MIGIEVIAVVTIVHWYCQYVVIELFKNDCYTNLNGIATPLEHKNYRQLA